MKKLFLIFTVFFLAFSVFFIENAGTVHAALTGTERAAAISNWKTQDAAGRAATVQQLGTITEAERRNLMSGVSPTTFPDSYNTLFRESQAALAGSNTQVQVDRGNVSPEDGAAAQAKIKENLQNARESSCGMFGFECMLMRLVKWIALAILWLFSWLLMIAGRLLDFSVQYLVAGMGYQIAKGGFGGPIEDLWKLIRDLVNISFLFALIYIGLSTIVNGASSGMKEKLKSVIVSALLVNFSLYFAKVVIDIANLAATTIYNSLQGIGATQGQSISALFMNHLNLSSMMLGDSAGDKTMEDLMQKSIESWEGLLPIVIWAFGASILMFKLTFAFALGAFLLILRFVMLIILMITAPIAFLPKFLPGLGSYGKKWWDTLIAQSFMAPLFLFGIFMTLKILSSIPGHTGNLLTVITGTNGGWDTGMRLLLFYVVAVVMIVGTTVMAKSMSAQGASFATGATTWVDKKLKSSLNTTMVKPFTASARSGVSYAGRNMVGRLSNEFSKKADTNTWQGRLQRTDKLGLGRVARGIAKKGEEAKFGGHYSRKDDKDWAEKRKQSQNKADRGDERKKKIAEYEDTKKAFEKDPYLSSKWLDEKRIAAEKAVQEITLTELEGQSVDELKKISGLLSQKQTDHIKDHKEKWTEGDKKAIKDTRESQHLAWYEQDAELFLKNKKPADIAKLSEKILLHEKNDAIVPFLSGEVLRKIQDGAELNPEKARNLAQKLYTHPSKNASVSKFLDTARAQGYYGVPSNSAPTKRSALPGGRYDWQLYTDIGADPNNPSMPSTTQQTPMVPAPDGGRASEAPAFIPPGTTSPNPPAFMPPASTRPTNTQQAPYVPPQPRPQTSRDILRQNNREEYQRARENEQRDRTTPPQQP